MLDRSLIGKQYPKVNFEIEKQRLIFFSKSTGQTDPVYFDEAYAKSKGHPSLLAPPTFLTTVGYQQDKPYEYLDDINIPISRILHAGQSYTYFSPIYAGDNLKMNSYIKDIYDKKKGSLQFLVFFSNFHNQKKIKVAEMLSTLVIK